MRLIKNAVLLQIDELKMWPNEIEFAGCHGHQNLILYGLASRVTTLSGLRGALLLHEFSSPCCKLRWPRPETSGYRGLRQKVVVLFYKVYTIFTRTNTVGRVPDTLCLKFLPINAF